jgi:hypothetical protein
MRSRVEWLKFQVRHGRPEKLPRTLLHLFVFEVYYQLCALRGYKPRHVFLDPSPESLRNIPPGEKRVLLIWPRLPLSIRMLKRICPYANSSHAEFVLYTPEAEAAARAAGRRVAMAESPLCEFKLRRI